MPLRLEHNCRDAPPIFKTLTENCPAINRLVNRSEPTEAGGEQYLEEFGDDVHRWGLYAHSIFDADLSRLERFQPQNFEIYRDYVEEWFEQRRLRDDSGHNWPKYEYKSSQGGHKIPSCEIWERDFHTCNGCPHKGREDFTNPIQLFWDGEPLKLEFNQPIETDTNENIARQAQKEADDLIHTAYNRYGSLDLLIRSVQGTFKSTYVSRKAARFAAVGANILIAVPTGRLAMEMKERLEKKYGQKVFVVMSHRNLFKYFEKLIECPHGKEINKWQAVGVSKRSIVSNYCKGCPHKKECPFPEQYTNSVESDARIVIVQHAHFRSKQAVNVLLKKQFRMMFIDETFMNSTFTYVRLTKLEQLFLQSMGRRFTWAKDLSNWIRGGVPKERIEVSPRKLNFIKKIYDARKIPWNLPLAIEHYNNGRLYMPDIGLFQFHPVPEVPIRIMTDATAPLEYCKIILNNPDIKVVGKRILTDVTLYNPANKMFKVVDGSTSRSAMSDVDRLERLLRFIGYKARTDYKKLTILVTVYDSDVRRVQEFFKEYYPEENKRITVASMSVGTNEWRDINVQFQLCGVHLNLKQMKIIEWQINNIENYWRLLAGNKEKKNPYPHRIKGYSRLKRDEEMFMPVQVKMLNPKRNKLTWDGKSRRWNQVVDSTKRQVKAVLVKIKNILLKKPIAFGEEMAYFMSLGITQQGRRIRCYWKKIKDKSEVSPFAVFKMVDGELYASDIKHYWNMSKRYEPGSCYTDIVIEDQLYAEAGLNESPLE